MHLTHDVLSDIELVKLRIVFFVRNNLSLDFNPIRPWSASIVRAEKRRREIL